MQSIWENREAYQDPWDIMGPWFINGINGAKRMEFSGMIHFITINNHSNPQQPIHSLRLAPVSMGSEFDLRRTWTFPVGKTFSRCPNKPKWHSYGSHGPLIDVQWPARDRIDLAKAEHRNLQMWSERVWICSKSHLVGLYIYILHYIMDIPPITQEYYIPVGRST